MKSRLQLMLGVAVVAALLILGMLIWIDRMQPVQITVSPLAEQEIRVSMTGAVNQPGVVRLPAGARLQDAVDAAGGFTEDADLTALNLAGRVGDGEQIVIPVVGAEPTPVAEGEAGGTEAPTNINTAGVAELDELPGIGEVLAGRIVDYRETHGPFTSVEQLAEIEGISPRLVDRLRPYVTVGNVT